MTMLARAPLGLRQQIARVRVAAPARFSHGHYHHLPFQFPGNRKLSFGVKVAVFLTTGFTIPFAAAAYQLKKAGAA
ncbi:hypothetical protein BJ138DRAFT_1140371 [Hygrophoropsis aurantiaca]|uniref:Uncharacterized protein n=1 Tax=Hygrophoropsis aurantiaca TaxID=72124 RepID=A0ACB8AT56_9AGAM|nr:hypothetical protein BJ138DRAFT_1140371 [Hygrophoropsis aurantiaca]